MSQHPMSRVYTASKIHHAQLWLDIKRHIPEIHWTARWPAFIVAGISESPELAPAFWLDDETDVTHSTVCLVYSHQGETIRGALVEAGIALATGAGVIVVGKADSYGTWQYHPQCTPAEDLWEALEILGALTVNIEKVAALHPQHFGLSAHLRVVE